MTSERLEAQEKLSEKLTKENDALKERLGWKGEHPRLSELVTEIKRLSERLDRHVSSVGDRRAGERRADYPSAAEIEQFLSEQVPEVKRGQVREVLFIFSLWLRTR